MAADKSITTTIGIILLSAGGSVRLGRPKQLLDYHSQTLLQHSLQTALASESRPVVVVLGADADELQKKIKGDNLLVVKNDDWQEGMASSIRCGLKAIAEAATAAEGVILMVCDQPYVTSALLNDLIAAHRKTGKQIVACSYENTFGPPVFFHRSLFQELLQLKGDIGARNIVNQHTDLVETIPFPEGTFDVDTEADYERLKATTSNDKRQL